MFPPQVGTVICSMTENNNIMELEWLLRCLECVHTIFLLSVFGSFHLFIEEVWQDVIVSCFRSG